MALDVEHTHLGKQKVYSPLVWFLYTDLEKSARSLTNKYLGKSIENAVQILICVHYYYAGIMSNSMFRALFSKERADETIQRVFPGLDYGKFKFKYFLARHRVSKWTRACKEHCRMMEDYLACLLDEWNFRFPKKPHRLSNIAFYLLDQNRMSERIKAANLKTIVPEWKSIDPKFRSKDIYLSYRNYYKSKIRDPMDEYKNVPRDIPDFLVNGKFNFC